MGIIKTNDNFVHPEGKIQLLNGKVLDCYPLEQPKAKMDNELKLDVTGTYMSVGKPKPVAAPISDEQKKKRKRLFLNNAFLFFQHRDRIMSDSRMFLCPIPIQSGLAYTGTSGFQRPTLGVYLEWWLNCESATIGKKDDLQWLVYRIAGSPLSGSNRCGIVNSEGKTDSRSLSGSFASIWSSFMRINNRYDEAKSLYQAYTLEDVINIMGREGLTTVNLALINEAFRNNGWVLKHIFMRGNRYEKGNDVVTYYSGQFKLNGKNVSNEFIFDMLHIVIG
ncbi:MAG: hypothetical protein IKT08_07995 [Bacteroidales bacterium]|nr:hypothetical protein [Bacteroidales bacterium]